MIKTIKRICITMLAAAAIASNFVFASASSMLTTSNPGTVVYNSGAYSLDASNVNEGYVSCRYNGKAARIKVQITKVGGITYTQDLRTDGAFEVFPLTQGDGSYTISAFEHVKDSMYSPLYSVTVQMKLRSPNLPFLYPNQYVNYGANSVVVSKAAEITAGANSELAKVEKIYNYIVKNIVYDTYKAETVQSGYLPSVDSILASGKGICFDYGAVMASMLRSQGIPTRLEIGYVSGGAYHAWISVYTAELGWINGAIQFDGVSWKLMDPTFASSGSQSASVTKFIGNGTNYSPKFYY